MSCLSDFTINPPVPKIPIDLITQAELFLNEPTTKQYLYKRQYGIISHELDLAKGGKKNELAEWLPKMKIRRDLQMTSIINQNQKKEQEILDKYYFWSRDLTANEIKQELTRMEKKFQFFSSRELTYMIGDHTQKKYRTQNRTNDYMRMIIMIETGMKVDEKFYPYPK